MKPIVTRVNRPLLFQLGGMIQQQMDGPESCQHSYDTTIECLNIMGADIPASLSYFEQNGGHCDCEVMFNIVLPEAELEDHERAMGG